MPIPPLLAVLRRLSYASPMNGHFSWLCSGPCFRLCSPLSLGFLSLCPGFTCHLDHNDPQVYTSSLDLSSETRTSTGRFHLAQTHRSKWNRPSSPVNLPIAQSPHPSESRLSHPDSSLLLISIANKLGVPNRWPMGRYHPWPIRNRAARQEVSSG